MADKIGGMAGKLISGITKSGPLLGGIVGLITGGEGINGIQSSIMNLAAGHFHAPNPNDIIGRWGTFATGLGAVIGGVAIKAFGSGIHPVIGKVGTFLTGFGGGVIAGGVAGSLLWSCTHSDGVGGPTGRGSYVSYAGANYGTPHGGAHPTWLSGSRHNPHGAYTEPSIPPYGTTHIGKPAGVSPHPYA